MSLGIVIKGPEGLVLAAESRLTLTAHTPDGAQIPASFDNATKVFGFRKPHIKIGVVTYGLGGLGLRSPFSFVGELEEELSKKLGGATLSVTDFADELSRFFMKHWKAAMPEPYVGPPMTFIVAGFNDDDVYGRMYVVELPNAPEPVARNAEASEFGFTWGGQREWVDRLVQGYDARTVEVIRGTLSLTDDKVSEVTKLLAALQMPVPVPAMPLQDCVDLAIFFVKTTMEAQRLSVGVRGCGGPIDVATITKEKGMQWVQRKQIHGESPTVQGGQEWNLAE